MKGHLVISSCDWYQVSCVSDWGLREKLKPHEVNQDPLAPPPLDGKRELIEPEGVVYECGGMQFICKKTDEVNPAYVCSRALYQGSQPIMIAFFVPRNPNVNPNSCQAKVANSLLYNTAWFNLFETCLKAIQWKVVRISRIDVCGDFEFFVNGRLPLKFVQDYLSKPTAARPSFLRKSSNKFRAFGAKAGGHILYETLAFGSRDSAVQVNLYNKSKELMGKDKPWIRDKWKVNGLPWELDGKRWVWRLEFSINPSAKFVEDNYRHIVREILASDVNTEGACATFFSMLVPDFFSFKYLTTDDIRKHRRMKDLKPVQLFDIAAINPNGIPLGCLHTYKSNPFNKPTGRAERIVIKKLEQLIDEGILDAQGAKAVDRCLSQLKNVWCDKALSQHVEGVDILKAMFRRLYRPKVQCMSRERAMREADRIATILCDGWDGRMFDKIWKGWDAEVSELQDWFATVASNAPDWGMD